MDLKKTAENINILADFCGVRDIEELRQNALKEKYGFEKADVLILFGGSIPAGCDTAAAGYLNGAAPVSYTHLDVYKRQISYYLSLTFLHFSGFLYHSTWSSLKVNNFRKKEP